MKKMMILSTFVSMLAFITACSASDPYEEYQNFINNGGMMGGGTIMNGNGSMTASSGELTEFVVEIDKTTAEPTDIASEYFPEDEDNLNNNSFTTEIAIDMSNPTAKTENGVTITVNGGHITANHASTKNICYVLSGTTTNGSFTVLGDKKYEIKLNDVTITNPDSAALNLLSSKRAYVLLTDGTTNKLTDGTSSVNDHKGALYCKGKLLFNGNGKLEVYGNYNNAIHSVDYIIFRKGNNVYAKSTANHGIKANDGIYINGGIVNVEVTAAAAKGINCESHIVINGGRTTVITTGDGTYEDNEAKGAAAIKADSTFTLNGGIVKLKSTGSGGKGLKTDYPAEFNGGEIYVITEGSQYKGSNDTASPKGIKIDDDITINGGKILVRTKGTNGEGIESKSELRVIGGTVMVSAYDDAINSSGNMYIKGGDVICIGKNNDGLDANGNMYISGGNIVAFGASGAEAGIDIGEQYKLYITGGNIFGIGGRIDGTLGSTTQGIACTSGSVQENSTVTVSNGSSTIASFNMPPYSYSNGTILVSSANMESGSSYTLNLGSSTQTISASNTLNSGMGNMGGGMPGGGMPGGW